MTTTIHFDAEFAAAGGPAFDGPTVEPEAILDIEAASVAVMFNHRTLMWAVVDGQGNVMAEADDPADLAPWMTKFLTVMSRETLGEIEWDA